MNQKWKRRDFLRSAVFGSLLAPVASVWSDLAEAQGPRTYLVLVMLPNGKCRTNVFITRNGADWTFGPGFTPYDKVRQDLIVMEKYNFQEFTAKHYKGDGAGHHDNAICMFSGEVPFVDTSGRGAMAPTIDQIVAWDLLNRGVITDPLRKSLNAKIPQGGYFKAPTCFYQVPTEYQLGKTYTTEMKPVSQQTTPEAGFKVMFGGMAPLAGGGATVDKLWKFGRSILDVPGAELKALAPTLPASGKAILDEHLQLLRELEAGLASESQASALQPPSAPVPLAATPENHEKIWADWVRVIDASFRFDRTRIATVQFSGCAGRFRVPGLGLGFVGMAGDSNSGEDHHSYTHWQEDKVDLFMKWFAERVVELVTALKGDGAGRANLLRDTAMLVGCEFGWNHSAKDVPVVLLGQAGGFFKTGRAVTYANELTATHKHTGTLLSMCHAMGVTSLRAVGNPTPAYQQGPVPELRG